MKKYKIFKVYHDRELLKTFPCPEDRIYYDTSQNEWGKYFCEGLIFFDDNLDIDAEYIGLEHYCRSFTNLNVNTADKYLKDDKCWVWYKMKRNILNKDIGYFSSGIFRWEKMDTILFDYLKSNKFYDELFIAVRPYLSVHRMMFVLKREDFIKMRKFVRDITNHFLKVLNINKPSDIDELVKDWKPDIYIFRGIRRLFAFMIEHFVSIWIAAHIQDIEEFPNILPNGYKEWRYDDTNLDIHLVDHCNLNCMYCCHMAPFADKFFLSPEKFEEDLSSIPAFVLNKFKNIYLLGGEPLLHPQVNELVIIARKYFPNKDIVLLSNGILLPKMSEDFYNNLIKNRIFLSITQYPIDFDYSILKELKKKGIEVLTRKIINKTLQGFSRQQLDPTGQQDINYQFKFCLDHRTINCLQLDGTILRPCPEEKHAKFLKAGFKEFKEDWLDLSKVTNIQELDDWYYTPKKFCSQCANDKWSRECWKVSKREISEYV